MDKDKQITSLDRMLKLKTDDWLEVCKEYDLLEAKLKTITFKMDGPYVCSDWCLSEVKRKELEVEVRDLKSQIEHPNIGYKPRLINLQSKLTKTEAEIKELNRQKMMEQGAWEQTDAYKEENAKLKIKLAQANKHLRHADLCDLKKPSSLRPKCDCGLDDFKKGLK